MSDKDFFNNDPMLRYVLQNFDISSEQAFAKSKEEVYNRLKDKQILTGVELMSLPEVPDNYIIDKMLWKGDVVIVLATEKAGKSILGLQMACALTKGGHFLGEYEIPESHKVLYVQAEGSREETQNRLRAMNKEGGISWMPENFYHMYPHSLSLDTDEGLETFMNEINKVSFKPDIIFIDPLYMAMAGDLIDNKASRYFCRNIRKIKDRFDCTIVINHHKRRPQKDSMGNYVDHGDDEIMGSFVWKAFPSHILTLHKKPNNLRTLKCQTQRGGSVIKDIVLKLLEPDPLCFEIVPEEDSKSCNHRVIEYFSKDNKGISAEQLAKELKINPSSVRKSFAELLKEKKIFKHNSKKRPTIYSAVKGEQCEI